MTQDARLLWAGLVLALYTLFCIAVWRYARARGRVAQGGVLVAFASQTGMAEELARATAKALTARGEDAVAGPLGSLTAEDLRAYRRVLFVVSTTGEGDAPDSAARFQRTQMARPTRLDGLAVGVLALGDRAYADFCAFGRRLDAWLAASGSARLFERIEVDAGDPAAIARWGEAVADGQGTDFLAPPAHQSWRLVERRRLNPRGQGDPVFLIALAPPTPALEVDWAAGDVVEIERVVDGATHHREYSIASLPADGRIELVVREHRRPDGSVGLMSGWLTGKARLNSAVRLRVRTNNNFHAAPGTGSRILIGAGTGVAGLRAHLKVRGGPSWLIFGERTRAGDYLLGEEIDAWVAEGRIARLDLAFSREGGGYVQDRLRDAAVALRAWIADGATLFVCGSLAGMGHGVHEALNEILGADRLRQLTEAGRYRRDLY